MIEKQYTDDPCFDLLPFHKSNVVLIFSRFLYSLVIIALRTVLRQWCTRQSHSKTNRTTQITLKNDEKKKYLFIFFHSCSPVLVTGFEYWKIKCKNSARAITYQSWIRWRLFCCCYNWSRLLSLPNNTSSTTEHRRDRKKEERDDVLTNVWQNCFKNWKVRRSVLNSNGSENTFFDCTKKAGRILHTQFLRYHNLFSSSSQQWWVETDSLIELFDRSRIVQFYCSLSKILHLTIIQSTKSVMALRLPIEVSDTFLLIASIQRRFSDTCRTCLGSSWSVCSSSTNTSQSWEKTPVEDSGTCLATKRKDTAKTDSLFWSP